MAEDEGPPNKSGRKPLKPLEVTPSKELVMDGKKVKESVTTLLKLRNVSKNKVAYKVMCNHPFVITVDKEIGFIEPGAMATLTITRVQFDAEKYDSQGRRTTLLVQHVTVSHKADNIAKIWASVIGGNAMRKRLAVKLMGADNRVLGENVKDDGSGDDTATG